MLPAFERPPVVETVLGVEFAPIGRWGIPHFGLYWEAIRTDYPEFVVQPPLRSHIEQFAGASFGPNQARLEPLAEPAARCWFINEAQDRLIQVQKDRFIHNWRRPEQSRVYPRYGALRPLFEAEWERFLAFVRQHALGDPEVRQCEVTYVNHIEMDDGWRSFSDLNAVLPFWKGLGDADFLPEPETAHVEVRFLMPDQRGRLHAELRHALRGADAKEVLLLTLTARGRPSSSKTADVMSWLDMGREWVVRGFEDLTTEEMHRRWGRKERA